MAKPISNIGAFTGTIDGITYYTLNGKRVCRKASAPTRDQIQQDPRFAAVKKNNSEFGGASTYARAIRSGLGKYVDTFKDHSFHSRLTSCCQKIIKKGRGEHGQRTINVLNYPEALIGFPLNTKNAILEKLAFLPELQTTVKGIKISWSGMGKINLDKPPNNASHYVLIALINSVPGYAYHKRDKKYIPTRTLPRDAMSAAASPPLKLSGISRDIEIFLPFPKDVRIQEENHENPDKMAHTIWLGIQYGQQINAVFHPLETGKSMQCLAVC
ncbi:MAG: hypothetical protein CL868_15445 [Cytophagaceae bacterium]|nr:hypothetical protein [Cytophagaceae bacterium]|tara:strand:+ start:2322 stop:3134 length:813 start_codon:yes stop_codon:yes gene_type:complete